MTSFPRFLITTTSRRFVAIYTLLVLACAASSSLAAEYHWQGNGSQTGDFNQPLWTRGKPGDADYVAANAGPPGVGDAAYTNSASLTTSGGTVSALHVEGGTFTVAGNFQAVLVDSTGVITGSGTLTARQFGAFNGTTTLQGAHVETANVAGGVNVTQTSTLRVSAKGAGAKLDLFGQDTITVDATSQALVGQGDFGAVGTLQIAAGGQVKGIGAMAAHVVVAPGGLLAPAGDAGALTIQGDLDLANGSATADASQVNITLAGKNNAAQLVVTGKATLGGTLYVNFYLGDLPNAGDSLTFLQAGSLKGKFQLVTSFGVPATMKKNKTAGSVDLQVLSVTPGVPGSNGSVEASATVGEFFNYGIAATNDTNGYAAQGLPPGLRLDSETGQISGTPTQAGDFPVYLILSNNQATGAGYIDITVADAPITSDDGGIIVTAVATTAFAYEHEQTNGIITVTRTGQTVTDLTVGYSIKGSAVAGVDYKTLKGSVTIPAGSTAAKIRVKALDVGITGYGVKTVKIVLQPGDGYSVGAASTAKVKIYDNDLPPGS